MVINNLNNLLLSLVCILVVIEIYYMIAEKWVHMFNKPGVLQIKLPLPS